MQNKRFSEGKTRLVNNKLINAPKPISSFSNSTRFEDKIADMGPPPGTYDTAPSWKAKGVVPMVPDANVIKKKQPETLPGPGEYDIPSTIRVKPKNRKNVMLSTGKRFEPEYKVNMS